MSEQQRQYPPQLFRYIAVLDFEATCDSERKIEFPIILLETSSFTPVAEFHHYVKPVKFPTLTDFCINLTGITQDVVDGGQPFPTVYNALLEFIETHNLTTENCLFATCGDWDLKSMLPTQLTFSRLSTPAIFNQWCNVKLVFQSFYARPHQLGMDGMLKVLGEPLIGRHHSGIDDARNISTIVKRLARDGHVFTPTSFGKNATAPTRNPSAVAGLDSPALNAIPIVDVTAAVAGSSSSSPRPPKQPKQPKPQPEPKSKKAKGELPDLPDCGYSLVDIGANLSHDPFTEATIPDVLKRAKKAGNVSHVMITGTNVRRSEEAIEMCKRWNASPEALAGDYPKLNCTVGVHPHDAQNALKHHGKDLIPHLRSLIENNRDIVVAVGECGLDFDRNFSPPDIQIEVFELQLKGIVHCYTGESWEHLQRYLDLDFYIGITGWVADPRPGRGAGLAKIVPLIPMDKLMVETDAPFLAPRNVKPIPRTNEPALLPLVVKAVAECYGVPEKEIAEASTRNAMAFFGLH
ncbi:hypothetical protein HDU76_008225 [Blyttiomyces sp. JEL0837]|nr:hypothetical protein HDU76_008225 [Blyttiomyces sp. JEL0837]